MVEIKCTVNEKTYLLKIIKYSQNKRIEEFMKGKITRERLDIDLGIIETLKARVNGIYREDYSDVSAKPFREQLQGEKENLPHLDLPYIV